MVNDINPVVDVIARSIHNDRRKYVNDLIYESHSIERKIRNKYKNKDIEYENLNEDDKNELRIAAHKIIQSLLIYDKSLEQSFKLKINPV